MRTLEERPMMQRKTKLPCLNLRLMGCGLIGLVTISCGMDPADTEVRSGRGATSYVEASSSNQSAASKAKEEPKKEEKKPEAPDLTAPKCEIITDSAVAYVGTAVPLVIRIIGNAEKVSLNGQAIQVPKGTYPVVPGEVGSNFYEVEVQNQYGANQCIIMLVGVSK